MPKHFQRELETLKRELLAIGMKVEEALRKATTALMDGDVGLAEEVREADKWIDAKEVELEEECLKVMALNQPVASDLRFIITVLKVNNDLERMGDHARSIAKRAKRLKSEGSIHIHVDFAPIVEVVRAMVRDSLDALVNLDTELARQVCAKDDVVDNHNSEMKDRLQILMQENTNIIPSAIAMLSASKHLERIADLSTNIAEDVVFMVEGEVIRHGFHHESD